MCVDLSDELCQDSHRKRLKPLVCISSNPSHYWLAHLATAYIHYAGCTLNRTTLLHPNSSFADITHAVHTLRLDWQDTSSKGRASSFDADMLLAALNNVNEAADRAFTDSSIQGRMNHLVYTIHASSFKATLVRHHVLSTESFAERRMQHLETMKAGHRKVVHAFATLKQLSPIPLISWDILHLGMSAGLILGALEKAFGTNEQKETLEKLRRALPSCCSKIEAEHQDMAIAPFYHGLEVLEGFIGHSRS
ncbi:hypothetical protein LTR09_011288 [Extremus antarcticus]|uniref:Uncharacterized protein n=1 Tax=Extremus antarcticus TaxID=702011 RepID=A0AAJ0GAH4_9PEZI|nr:hypothetical protein LTR09_011288 [Extremus antarcticus]